jgi:AraC-like DNA-binding protein
MPTASQHRPVGLPSPKPARLRLAPAGEPIEVTDLDRIEHILSGIHASMRIDAGGQRGGMRLTRAPLSPSARLDHIRFSMSFTVKGTALGVVHINHLRSGRAAYGTVGGSRSYGPGDVFLAVQPEDPYTARSEDADVQVAVIEPTLLSRIADAQPRRAQPPVRFTGYEPISAPAAQAWKSTSAYIRNTILASPEMAASPMVTASAARLLAVTALATFPSNAVTQPTAADRRDAHPDTLRRAIAYVDAHAADPDVTAADIAAACHVTIRAVQLAFRRHLDTTPTDYLRRVRLSHAHHDLVRADPGRDTVTAVAYRWGFSSPGVFSARYRHAYGVTPGHTLRQG